ncbi:MAG: circadian clock KaiB family protein [Thiohalomonadaceae bacterium]
MSDGDSRTYRFLVFVADHESDARQSIAALSEALDRFIPGQYQIELVDVLRDPERAEQENVFATPMLVRSRPSPTVRILGDLGEPERLIALLGLEKPAD